MIPEVLARNEIVRQPAIIAIFAVPIQIQVCFNFGLAFVRHRVSGEAQCAAGASALINASNFIRLAAVAAISLFGFTFGAVLATVVGLLIEAPVTLSVVAIVNASKGWYERGAEVQRAAARRQFPGPENVRTVQR